jgi:hypothetical protein
MKLYKYCFFLFIYYYYTIKKTKVMIEKEWSERKKNIYMTEKQTMRSLKNGTVE